ncbi:MAG TPA: hypothetical protein VER08_03930 [Pyrinomonadaceae bacterium]|nr:hypothetical protein [Pyrinomonadaceae bacterium]
MKSSQRFFAAPLALAFALSLLPHGLTNARAATPDDETDSAQSAQVNALQRGFRTGYSDGYQAGWRDSNERRARDYRSKEQYQRADRVYVEAYGPVEDYRDGYRQGFESGYATGYERRGFDSTIPATLARRGAAATDDDDADARAGVSANNRAGNRRADDDDDDPPAGTVSDSTGTRGGRGAATASGIPVDTVLRVELLNRLSTDVSQRGDPFQARVVEPSEYEGALLQGRVVSVKRAGRMKGTSELQLSFEQIRLPDGRYENFSAQVVEVVDSNEGAGVGDVDEEGGVRGRDSTRDDAAKVGASAGIGAIIGAIAGGGKGAAIGAVIGAGAGTGGVLAQRGNEIRLERGTNLRIRTSR